MPTNFTVNKADLEFILKQIVISERNAAGESLVDIIGPDAAIAPFGLRTTDGSFNNLLPGQSEFGASDNIFSRLLPPDFRNDADGDTFDLDGPGPMPAVTNNNYGTPGHIADADPRIISNLIVDMSITNPAAIEAWRANPLAVAAAEARWEKEHPGVPFPSTYTPDNIDLSFIPNQSPDIGLSPGFNGWFTFFGQFFDHGLDLITKGGNGLVLVPLQPDDPLYSTAPGANNFMVLSRATPAINPATGLPTEHTNTTTAFVDQNQTYTSHPSHQVFLREYKFSVDSNNDGIPDSFAVPTGHLMDGAGGIATWAETKAQAKIMLGIILTDADVANVPLLRTDAYGKFIPGANGFAQIATPNGFVEGAAGGLAIPANAIRTNHAFLDDIAHAAVPFTTTGGNKTADTNSVIGLGTDSPSTHYDNELLDAHFITGDGRGNENIGLTAVHNVFHSEHNRLVEANKATILEAGAADVAFLNDWLLTDVAAVPTTEAGINALVWDGERLFQAAKFVTEMQYQHLVFEEFARKVQPNVDPFVFSNSPDLDPQILAEFAHVVYRFGHSMLSPTVARTDANMNSEDIALFDAFLNPVAFTESGLTAKEATGAIVRGMTRQIGNEIDEFVTSAVRNTLLGLPLDLPAINIARARDTGVPTLNDARKQFYDLTGDAQLKPYESWADYAQNIKNPFSIINFIAAYGTHSTITAATTLQGKRDAATLLVLGDSDLNGDGDNTDANEIAPADRIDFLTHTGTWLPTAIDPKETGLNNVDFWIGGLAEAKMEFGGMLGSTFNFVFETQLENLQNGDRFYYLSRLQGTNMLNELEPNSFAALVMRNTDLGNDDASHLSGQIFDKADHILELDLSKQPDPDPVDNNPILGPKVLRDNPNTSGPDTNYLKFRGGEHVVLGGSEVADILIGDKGIDTLWGDGGNDLLNAQSEADNVFGGDGDDIIIDPFGDDILRGDEGNDVVSAGPGLDLAFGGAGKDFIHAGADTNEVFAGRGDDFVMGGNGGDMLLGNEDNDWLEGGDGFDTLAGENSELFFNSPIIGHDVLNGQGNDTDYDGESGDDIMLSGVGIQRNEGMFGFDWSIAKTDPFGVDHDMTIKVFTTVEADILRDRYDLVEAMSGWTHDDILRGDDRGSAIAVEPEQSFEEHVLDQAGINRITGLQELLGTGVTSFRDGNIIMGGDGNDIIQGRAGFDILDGDAWLNVRIAVANEPGTTSVENMNALLPRMLSGEINPGQLSIVREILQDTTPANDTDMAVFHGNLAEYTIEGRAGATRAADLNGDGFITVTDNNDGPVVRTKLIDDVDKLKNIELLKFADQTIAISGPDVIAPTNIQWTDTTSGSALPGATTIATLSTEDLNSTTFTYTLVSQSAGAGFTVSTAGAVARTSVMPVNTSYTLTIQSRDQTRAVFAETFTVMTGSTLNDTLNGNASDDIMYGLSGNDTLNALGGDDTLNGGDGNDTLVGGTGNDVMRGGAGDDLYNVDARQGDSSVGSALGDSVIEAVGGGSDTVQTDLETYNLDENVEHLMTTTASAVNHNWTGNALNNRIQGDLGSDELNGLAGNDILLGRGGDDTLNGGEGNDWIDGGTENDVMTGGAGNDRYVVDSAGDIVIEVEGEGIEQIQTTLSAYDLAANAANVEHLVAGAANIGSVVWNGSALGNYMRSGGGNDTLNGLVGNDYLLGLAGDDTLDGGEGNDFLDGGTGNDMMTGGADNDRYVVDSAGDTVIELEGGGIEEIQTTLSAYDLAANAANAEHLVAGAANIGSVVWNGSALGNYMRSGGGNDTLSGLAGNDYLLGLAGDDTLNGGEGNDFLDGGTGNDMMTGGAGNDRYVVDSAGDIVTELEGGGIEEIQTTLNAYDLAANAANAEHLVADTANIGSVVWNGSALGNYMRSGNGNDTLSGLAGNDYLLGLAGDDTLNGGEGNDFLDGGTGNDMMTGGAGNDTYIVHSAGDIVTELEGGGIEEIQTTLSAYDLAANAANVEHLVADTANIGSVVWNGSALINYMRSGNGNDTLSGLAGNDYLLGGLGDDTLIGGAGKDGMTGGLGSDIFVFGSVSESGITPATRDIIVDFISGQDDLNFAGIDANTATGANDAFSLTSGNGTGAFTAAGQLRWFDGGGGTTVVEGNVDGGLAADFQVALTGNHTLQGGDFIF